MERLLTTSAERDTAEPKHTDYIRFNGCMTDPLRGSHMRGGDCGSKLRDFAMVALLLGSGRYVDAPCKLVLSVLALGQLYWGVKNFFSKIVFLENMGVWREKWAFGLLFL